MKKILILLLIAVILFSGCIGEKKVKMGDNVSVDYIGSLDNGKVFDTSIEKVANESNLSHAGGYKPLKFTVGKGRVIKGFDEGVIGMKVGETRTLTIPPEKGYGLSKTELIHVFPIVQVIPETTNISKEIEITVSQFERVVGPGHKAGETVGLPNTNINLTVLNITASNVSLSYKLKVGDNIWSKGAPWNETVIKIDNKNITISANVSQNDIVQLPGAPWNSTVVGLDNVNITLRHNPIPETIVPGMFGQTKFSFNETSIIMDQNPELAGKTLTFKVTLVSIDK
ncbi:MAG: FKBP-type peptidyl-prolyl cis-trans isomerase [Candidatus Methanoperedens sp.]|nr:FKBP-type peptidyl-prolyl cis-trans isomerase [Candidatus Methanoperedens sp.]